MLTHRFESLFWLLRVLIGSLSQSLGVFISFRGSAIVFILFNFLSMKTFRVPHQWYITTSVFLLYMGWPSWQWPWIRLRNKDALYNLLNILEIVFHLKIIQQKKIIQRKKIIQQVLGIRLLGLTHQLLGLLLLLILLNLLTSWILFWKFAKQAKSFSNICWRIFLSNTSLLLIKSSLTNQNSVFFTSS